MNKLYLALPAIVLLAMGCRHSTEPVPVKDPSEYVWTIDTIAYPGSSQTTMYDIWGSSPRNLYMVGHNSQNRGLMWHFDGYGWSDVRLSTTQGGNILGPIDLSAVYGTSATNVFAVGHRLYQNQNPPPNFLDVSLILHSDGGQWTEESIEPARWLLSVSGIGPNSVWTCGVQGTLYRFDGINWQRDSVTINIPLDAVFTLWDVKAKSPPEAYMIGSVEQSDLGQSEYFLFLRQQNHWSVLDSFGIQPTQTEVKFGIDGLWISPQGTLYSYGPHIFRWTGSSWIRVYEIQSALRKMFGTSEDNLFAVGDFGVVLHYDGMDWQRLYPLKSTDVVFSSVWTDGSEAFIVGFLNDGSKTIVLHGK